jgi:hypothetical protein
MAQLDAQLASSGASESVGGSNLHLYGFADVSYYKYFIRQHSPFGALLYPKNAFAVGNLNVYLSGELSDHWRSLAEVRFTYLPNGNRIIDATGIHRTDTSVNDYTHLDQARRTGSIFIERAWLEYEASTALTVRAGSWLTPYGIWNEDHGSPTIIPVARPYVIGLELLPERQTGVMAFGSFYPSENLTLGYAVGVSNGRGPVQDYADLDERKALTLRFTGSYRSTGVFTFGASAYLGRYTDTQQVLTTVNGAARIDDRIVRQYDEVSVGLDARYVIGGFHAQAELISNQQAFTPEGRPIRIGTQFEPDGRRFGGYAIVGYRFKWLGLMPYVTGEYFSLNNTFEPTRPPTVDVYTDYAFGLNSRPTNDVTLKLEGTVGVFFVDHAEGSAFQYPVPAVQAQAAWVF